MIDTHAHIYLPDFDADRNAMLQRAAAAGITTILMPAIDTATHAALLQTAATWPWCKPMMGLHPCSVTAQYETELAAAETFLNTHAFVAIGEIGLDFYWDTTYKEQQYAAFETQIGWALQRNLPIVIHSRNAMEECIEVVQRFAGLRGVFHCFSGTLQQAQQIIACGFYLGIGGVLTYKKSGLDAVIPAVGLGNVILETDAPYLAPVPYRGKQNEPAYVPLVAQRLAQLTAVPLDAVVAQTTKNAQRLFALP